ncbi:hypothetical protein HDU97_000370 [Phlyctochytrium planicorne]|nr:hypothetical protein HDU97_000370 [Phlyctochytrium planicorne]
MQRTLRTCLQPSHHGMSLPLFSLFTRSYADHGKVAKTGQKKVAQKEEGVGDPLPPFQPKPPLDNKLPDVRRISPYNLGISYDPRGRPSGRRLLRAIDFENRQRHDFDNRAELISRNSPNAVEPGSILMVEQISSRSAPRKLTFAGVLISIKRTGIMSSITLRNYILGTGVEMVFPVFSPSVTKIKVLKRATGFAKGKDNIYHIRSRPALAPVSFNKIPEMVMRDNEAERIMSNTKR